MFLDKHKFKFNFINSGDYYVHQFDFLSSKFIKFKSKHCWFRFKNLAKGDKFCGVLIFYEKRFYDLSENTETSDNFWIIQLLIIYQT